MSKAKEVIACGMWAEFPDVLVTLELCRVFAQRDKRSVPASLRGCARALAARVENDRLQATLRTMSKSLFPETQISQIRDCIRKMETAVIRGLPDAIDKQKRKKH
ncbi:hypothetical protein OVA10_16860 [Lelliottia sp. SL45]|uniref:DUF7740 domain-containing protein n=1 Tax=Lelliottia sp. SL45 TaxID=2994665 RepID=UPI002276375C|nr:hypothetical protein [Lelliottia sp. SL45]MCY1699715.1 hypothetical protein [Lelliottia sp. SL45]